MQQQLLLSSPNTDGPTTSQPIVNGSKNTDMQIADIRSECTSILTIPGETWDFLIENGETPAICEGLKQLGYNC